MKACKEGGEASSPFAYASRLTEVMLLGVVALRAGQGRKIRYDADAMRITNAKDANRVPYPGVPAGVGGLSAAHAALGARGTLSTDCYGGSP